MARTELRFSNFSRIYECHVKNNFYYIIRNTLLNTSFLLTELEFDRIIDYLKKGKNNNSILELKKAHVLVGHNYNEIKLLNYLKNKYNLDKVNITTFYFLFNTKCNLNCKYCYIDKNLKRVMKNNFMSKNRIIELINFLEKFIGEGIKSKKVNKKLSFIFYGSEPFLYPEYLKILIKNIKRLSKIYKFLYDIKIITNGTILNKKIIKLLKREKVRIVVSIDGSKKINDMMRIFRDGRGTYSTIERFIKFLQINKVPFAISCTIGPHNIEYLKNSIKLTQKLKAKGIGFNTIIDSKNDLIPHVSINKSFDKAIEATLFAESINIYEDRLQRRIKYFNDNLPHFKECSAPGNQIVFYPNGGIGLCQAYVGSNKFTIGDIKKNLKNPLKILESQHLKNWIKKYPLNSKECLLCPAIGICGGGCIFNVEKRWKNINCRDKEFCVYMDKILNVLLKKILYQNLKEDDTFIRDITFMFK